MTSVIELEKRIRRLITLVIVGLVVSGLTAIPLEAELNWLTGLLGAGAGAKPDEYSGIVNWLLTVRGALLATGRAYPFLFYGTDWLAFAHLTFAFAFIGPWRDPVRNSWVITFGLVSCAGVVAVAMVAGWARGIPFYWRLIDSAFGVAAGIPLLLCRRYIRQLERLRAAER